MAYRRKLFMNCSTWVKCTICNGHIAQVLFFAKRSIYGDNQSIWMVRLDVLVYICKI